MKKLFPYITNIALACCARSRRRHSLFVFALKTERPRGWLWQTKKRETTLYSVVFIRNSRDTRCHHTFELSMSDLKMLELISLTLVCGLVDPSLFTFLLKLLQWGLASIYQVTLWMTFLSRQSSCVVIVPSKIANHAWLRIIVPTYWVSTLGLSTQLQNQFLP